MPRRRVFATARDLARKLTAESKGTSRLVREGRREQARGEGMSSLFAWPVLAAMRKLKGKDAVNRALYSRYHRPLKNVDEKLGRLLERELGTKKLFRQVDVLPTRRRMGKGKHRVRIEHETTSATAPVSKAVKAIAPLAATLYVAEKLDKIGEDKMADQIEDKNQLLKQAADALDAAQKRDHAIKLAFDMVERGKVPPFETLNEFEMKIASLMEKNLQVVQEALELDVDMPDFGKVASEGVDFPADATAAFYHRLAEE